MQVFKMLKELNLLELNEAPDQGYFEWAMTVKRALLDELSDAKIDQATLDAQQEYSDLHDPFDAE